MSDNEITNNQEKQVVRIVALRVCFGTREVQLCSLGEMRKTWKNMEKR